jgi:hypothetical protein
MGELIGRQPPYSGYLILRTYEFLYEEYLRTFTDPLPIYGVPRPSRAASLAEKRYRGIDRSALEPWTMSDLREGLEFIAAPPEPQASLELQSLNVRGQASGEVIRSYQDALSVVAKLSSRRDWELVWAAPGTALRSPGAALLGFEPNSFAGDLFSPLSDTMFFPRWHGTDEEGQLFRQHFERLNPHGLFGAAEDAERFLAHYQSLPWAEEGEFKIIAVYEILGGDTIPKSSENQ